MPVYIYTKYEKGKAPEELLTVSADCLLDADRIFEENLGFNPMKNPSITVRNPDWPCFNKETSHEHKPDSV